MAEPRDFKKEMGDRKKLHGKPAFSETNLLVATFIEMEKEKMQLEKSVSDGIALLFAENSCENCDGTDCPLLEDDGITCMGIEGLKIIPGAGQQHCKDCSGNFCEA